MKKHFTEIKRKKDGKYIGASFTCPLKKGCSGFHIEPENNKVECDECGKNITKEALPHLQKGWNNPKYYGN